MAGTRVRSGGDARRTDPVGALGLLAPLAAGCLLAVVTPVGAGAQGFAINEHGSCAMGRAGAAVAEPCDDGSTMFFNPAGLTGTDGVTLSAGATVISAFGDFITDATREEFDLENDPIPVPHLYASYGVTENLAFGVGTFVAYGLETQWPSDRATGFEGRFVGYDNSLQSFYIQPTVAYRPVDWLSLGAGVDVVVSTVELNQRLDLSRRLAVPSEGITFGQLGIPARTDFADAELEADPSTGVGGNFGVQLRPHEAVTFGARYTTQVTIDYEGEASFEQVPTDLVVPTELTLPDGTVIPAGTPVDALVAPQFQPGGVLADQGVATEITMPDQIAAGVAVRPTEELLLEADWQWVNWTDFDRVRIDLERAPDDERIQDYDNANVVRVGGQYAVNETIDLRGGYIYSEAASPDETVTPLLPENDRNQFTAGVGVRISPVVAVDASYQFIAQNDRRGRVEDPPRGREPTPALNSGLYEFAGHLFGATLTLHF